MDIGSAMSPLGLCLSSPASSGPVCLRSERKERGGRAGGREEKETMDGKSNGLNQNQELKPALVTPRGGGFKNKAMSCFYFSVNFIQTTVKIKKKT